MKLAEFVALLFYIVVGLIAIFMMYQVMQMPMPHSRDNRLCSVAEISPDITPAERERCRQLRNHKL